MAWTPPSTNQATHKPAPLQRVISEMSELWSGPTFDSQCAGTIPNSKDIIIVNLRFVFETSRGVSASP